MKLQQTTAIPEVKKTIVLLRKLSADEQIRQEAYYREKRMYDEESAMIASRREGRAEGRAEGADALREELTRKWREKGMTDEQIRALLEE